MYKVFIVTEKNIVKGYQEILNNKAKYEGTYIETDLDLEAVDIVNNYKLMNEQLIELTEEEKEANKIDICSSKTTEQKLEETNQMLTQIIINQL